MFAVIVDAAWWVLFVALVVFVFGLLHRAWLIALLGLAVFVLGLGLGGWVK